jgi:hypothetical protein
VAEARKMGKQGRMSLDREILDDGWDFGREPVVWVIR